MLLLLLFVVFSILLIYIFSSGCFLILLLFHSHFCQPHPQQRTADAEIKIAFAEKQEELAKFCLLEWIKIPMRAYIPAVKHSAFPIH